MEIWSGSSQCAAEYPPWGVRWPHWLWQLRVLALLYCIICKTLHLAYPAILCIVIGNNGGICLATPDDSKQTVSHSLNLFHMASDCTCSSLGKQKFPWPHKLTELKAVWMLKNFFYVNCSLHKEQPPYLWNILRELAARRMNEWLGNVLNSSGEQQDKQPHTSSKTLEHHHNWRTLLLWTFIVPPLKLQLR